MEEKVWILRECMVILMYGNFDVWFNSLLIRIHLIINSDT